ncbi:hypothetical protein Taro_037812 [Colocasia esculenta]|uniref:Uncharacterized protein n=1 Tax=Colocasia esculenta TaxID=4460 RepID=A0A843WDY6_COLES|nr:hypothetical protein [Colocasia esculenta]
MEVLPENILICSQLCAYMYIFPKGNSAQAEVLLETYSYIHKYCAYMYIFPKGNSAQTEVLLETYSYIHKYCAYMYIFPKRNSAQVEVLPETYLYTHKELCTYAYALGEKLCLNRDPAENTSICSRIICSCERLLKETLPKQWFCPKAYPYVHKYTRTYVRILWGHSVYTGNLP